MDDKELVRMRDVFREAADIIDELLELGEKENKGEDVNKELESVTGRFMYKMVEMNELSK